MNVEFLSLKSGVHNRNTITVQASKLVKVEPARSPHAFEAEGPDSG